MVVEYRGLLSDSSSVLKAEPGKLDYQKTQSWYSFPQFTSWFTLQNGDYDVIVVFALFMQ